MEDSPADPIPIQLARSQVLLTDFLRADLDLGKTFLSLATVHMDSNPDHARELVNKAAAVVAAVRQFEGRITDHVNRKEFHERASLLEVALAGLMSQLPKYTP